MRPRRLKCASLESRYPGAVVSIVPPTELIPIGGIRKLHHTPRGYYVKGFENSELGKLPLQGTGRRTHQSRTGARRADARRAPVSDDAVSPGRACRASA